MGATIRSGDGWSYTLTEQDKLWAARMARYEGGSPDDVLWTMTQYYARPAVHQRYSTFTEAIQAYSQPINPKWRRDGLFCRPGGEYHDRDNCAERRLAVRDTAARISWGELPQEIRDAVSEWFSGRMPNPVPKAVDFAAPNVSESFLSRNPGAHVVKRLDNWYIAAYESPGWPDGWVTMSPGVPWMAVGLAVLLGGVGAYAVSRRRLGRGLFGLEGTVAQHQKRAEYHIEAAREQLTFANQRPSDCWAAIASASMAEAEASWLGPERSALEQEAYTLRKLGRECVRKYQARG